MPKRLLTEVRPLETRVALIEDGKLCEMSIEREGGDGLTGNLYMGRVENVLNGMQAAFVNIGLDKNAFLSMTDFAFASSDFGSDAARVKAQLASGNGQKALRPGQEILVQVTKIPGGEKGVRVSGNITLPGRAAVLLPTVDFVGVSRRIEDERERERLRDIVRRVKAPGAGVIVRTAAEGATEEELKREIEALSAQWQALAARSRCVKAPALIHRDGDIIMRAVRDNLTDEVEQMAFENEEAFARACQAAEIYAPKFKDRIVLDKSDVPLFSRYGVGKQLNQALSRRVWLKSGGFLVFDHTEALTVVDVNTGKYVGKTSLPETIFKINLEAAEEIARQLRLRDIGGIIVIDFIDMVSAQQKQALLDAFSQALHNDRARVNLCGLTALGLVEMTRKRRREPLWALMKTPCPVCAAEGYLVNVESLCYDVFLALERKFQATGAPTLLATVSRRVATAMERLNPALDGEAYAVIDEKLNDTEFTISPLLTREIPPRARRIGGNHE